MLRGDTVDDNSWRWQFNPHHSAPPNWIEVWLIFDGILVGKARKNLILSISPIHDTWNWRKHQRNHPWNNLEGSQGQTFIYTCASSQERFLSFSPFYSSLLFDIAISWTISSGGPWVALTMDLRTFCNNSEVLHIFTSIVMWKNPIPFHFTYRSPPKKNDVLQLSP